MKIHCLMIISTEPIDPDNIPKDDECVRHFIKEELELKPGPLGGWRIIKDVSHLCSGAHKVVTGNGQSVSVVIADWLRELFGSILYRPKYRDYE